MALTLKSLCAENDNQFQLTLVAGGNGYRNAVTWVHIVEDSYIIPYFHGSELAVTTGIKAVQDPEWLFALVKELNARDAAGLVINIGPYVSCIPQEILDYADREEFPLLTMPWKISVADMVKIFCTRIISERQESALLDRALLDAILKRGDFAEHQEVLGPRWGPDCLMTVIVFQIVESEDSAHSLEEQGYAFINRLRRFKTINNLTAARFGVVSYEGTRMVVSNQVDRKWIPELLQIIMDVYADAYRAKSLYIGVGIEVKGITELNRSCLRAQTAMRMAIYRRVPYVRFEDMGIYQILFSVKDTEVLHAYADNLLGPIEDEREQKQGYLELLQAYIDHDRSLEQTAAALYLHRNTVNYRLQKLRELLGSPLKTVEDLFPYQLALAIRDMERKAISK